MKSILSLIISGALVVSGFGQTRNVLVGTNNAVVQPTNFWSVDSSNARVGLGVGTTNNVTFNRVVATTAGSLASPAIQIGTNTNGLAAIGGFLWLVNRGVAAITIDSSNSFFTGNLSFADPTTTRTNLGLPWSGLTNNDASSFRTALGLGTAATNPASAFQPSSATLSNLAAGNGSGITNLAITNIVGTIPIVSGGTGATNAANARNNLGATAVGTALFTATNEAAARTSLGATTVGGNVFTITYPLGSTGFFRINADNTVSAVSASDFRTSLSLGTAATNPATAFQPSSSALTNLSTNNGSGLTNLALSNVVGLQSALDGKLATNGSAINLTNFPASLLTTNGSGAGLTNLTAANITGTVGLASNITGVVNITNGGSGATTAGGARTNLGLGATWLTNTTASNFLSAVGLGSTNSVQFGILSVGGNLVVTTNQIDFGSPIFFGDRGTNAVFLFEEASDAAIARTNLGLGWSALTNTNAGTGLVSVNTNGEVVSPTNFWQVAPITTTFIESQPTTNFTTNIAAARFLHIHSLATNIVNVTNTVVLPTNGATFDGDIALVVHQGPTSSMTRVRTAGSTNDLVTMNRFDEAVEFVYYNNVWQFNHNLSFIEPIYFSGTNAVANAAASRTNLGLGAANEVTFNQVNIGIANYAADSITYDGFEVVGWSTNIFISSVPLSFNNTTNSATTRTNLGLGLAALTNTNIASFQRAILQTNTTPATAANLGDAKAWLEISVVTNNVTNSFRIPVFQ